jgi:C1A family cysteine protease
MMGYDTLLGSHYDKYYLDYTSFYKNVSEENFKLNKSMKCGDFPGPGAEHRITMNPMAEYVNHDDSHVHDMFHQFKKKHGKRYNNVSEEQKRKHQFMQNIRYIHSKNRKGLSYSLAVNHLADLSDQERGMMRGRLYTPGYNGGLPFNKYKYDLKSLPDSLDWRYFGAVTPVKDQAVCGSCWSFGTTGTIEGTYFIKYGQLVRLSQQELMDCSWDQGNNACDGGEDFRAYQWIMANGGLATEEDYGSGAYLAQDSFCSAENATKTAKIVGYVNVTSGDEEALRAALVNHGPVSVAIDASHKSLSFYANGVYYEPECGNKPDQLDHAVLAVGYGVMNGQRYWLIKNSWSTYWGNDGYVLMAERDNNCGVETTPTYVLM